MKKTLIVLSILLVICLLITWIVYNTFRVRECHEYEEFKKANEIIKKIENYKKQYKKLPDSLEEINETEYPIFYSKFDDEYVVSFGAGSAGCIFCTCTYNSETKEWINVD